MGAGNIRIGLILALLISWAILGINVYSTRINNQTMPTYNVTSESPQEAKENSFLGDFLNPIGEEKASPCDRVRESQILVFEDKIIIDFQNAEWATFTDTNSMDPVIDAGANALEYVPQSADEICVGDIVSYKSKYADGVIIHRVVDINQDSKGWYAIMKGDNNAYKDPGRVRFEQIQRVVIGVIY